MKSTLIALFAVISIPNAANADIRSECFQKWNTDYRMVEYCISQQTEARSKLQRTPSTPIKSRCIDKWNQDYRMVNYCIEQQSGSANRLGVTSSGPPAGSSAQNMAFGAPSGALVNGQAIPLCSHGGLCQGAMMRAIGRP
jgi:hypothetical protein